MAEKEGRLNRPGAILIRGTNWIGDSVMSLAALRELRRWFPDRRLVLAARPWVVGLFQDQGIVDEILSIPREAGAWREGTLLRNPKPRFEKAVVFPNSFAAALSSWLARIPERFGYNRDGRGWLLTRRAKPRIKALRRHQVYYYLDLLFQTGLSSVDYLADPNFEPDIHLSVPPAGRDRAEALLEQQKVRPDRPRIAINPGAYYGSAKRWFPERYARVADTLAARTGAEILLVGSAGELRLAEEIGKCMQTSPRILTGKTDLAELLGVLGSCRLLLTNDSGPMHLAAALSVPQLALFGSTDEVATGPLSPSARIIHKHVSCSPCLLRQCPIDLRCFGRITVEEVTRSALEMLEQPEVAE